MLHIQGRNRKFCRSAATNEHAQAQIGPVGQDQLAFACAIPVSQHQLQGDPPRPAFRSSTSAGAAHPSIGIITPSQVVGHIVDDFSLSSCVIRLTARPQTYFIHAPSPLLFLFFLGYASSLNHYPANTHALADTTTSSRLSNPNAAMFNGFSLRHIPGLMLVSKTYRISQWKTC